MKTLNLSALGCLALALSGCGLLYTNVRVPRAYRSATPADVRGEKTDPVATGESCNRSLLFLVAWGDGGYAKAVANALAGRQDAVLYDVKVDARVKSFLGLYTSACTEVTGRVGKISQ